jgi:hypothetical protein
VLHESAAAALRRRNSAQAAGGVVHKVVQRVQVMISIFRDNQGG